MNPTDPVKTDPELESLIAQLTAILDKPQMENIPDDLWGTIYPTWTGLWTDYHGSLDEKQPSDVYAVSDLLSEERKKKLLQELVAVVQSQRTALLEELEKEGPKDFPVRSEEEKQARPRLYYRERGWNGASTGWRSLIQAKKAGKP
jgi:hypothetical protein